MRRRLYLMRHGDVAYFPDPAAPVHHDEVVLTEAGVEQARAAGRALAQVRFDRVLTSGLGRTRRTAELVVEQLEAPPAAELEDWRDLREFRPGALHEVPDEDLDEGFLRAFTGCPPLDASYMRGETVGSLVARVNAAMDRLYADDGWDTVLAVLHGGVNRAILSWAFAGPGTYFAHFEQSPACINIVDGGPEFVIRAVNFTPYDPAHLGPRTTTLEEMLVQYRDFRRREAAG